MITIKTYNRTVHRFTGRELEINDLIRMYESRIDGIKERNANERSERLKAMTEMQNRICELEEHLAELEQEIDDLHEYM